MANDRMKAAAKATRKAFGTAEGQTEDEQPGLLERILDGMKDQAPLDDKIAESLKKVKKK